MRKAALLLGTIALLLVVNVGAFLNERLLKDGQLILLELVPRDPRSLMQGDYMALRFVVTNEVSSALDSRHKSESESSAVRMVLSVDQNGVGHFARLDDGTALAAQEAFLAFRQRDSNVSLTTDAWFFEEGQATRYQPARFGGFRIGPGGRALLASMHDSDGVAIEPDGS